MNFQVFLCPHTCMYAVCSHACIRTFASHENCSPPFPPLLPFTEIGWQITGRNCTLFTTRGELLFVMQSVLAGACSTLDEMEDLKGVWGHENSKDKTFEPPFFLFTILCMMVYSYLVSCFMIIGFWIKECNNSEKSEKDSRYRFEA